MFIFIVLVISGVSARDFAFLDIESLTPMYRGTNVREQEDVFCSRNMQLDFWDECECIEGTAYYPPMECCFVLFGRGPCEPGHYFVIPKGGLVAECVVNPCGDTHAVPYNNSCYFLHTKGPCKLGQGLQVNAATLEIQCSSRRHAMVTGYIADAPWILLKTIPKCSPGSRSNSNGQCQKEI